MRISELSAATGVPIATIKYYLREGLLPAGERTAATQASYGPEHVRRIGLVRALTGVGGLSVAKTRDVLAATHEPPPAHQLLGMVSDALASPDDADVPLDRARALVERWGWQIHDDDVAGLASLERALAAIDQAGFDLPMSTLDAYAAAMTELTRKEVGTVPTGSTEQMVEYVVLGTLLVEPLLVAIRRLGLHSASAERFSRRSV